MNEILCQFDKIIKVSLFDNKTVNIQGNHKDASVECELLAFATSFEAKMVRDELVLKIDDINKLLSNKRT
jgi:hypothetical protein